MLKGGKPPMYNKRNTLEERNQIVRKIFLLLAASVGTAFSIPSISIVQAIGPSWASPNVNAWKTNALQALLTSATTFPTPPVGNPTQYSAVTGPINPAHMINTQSGAFNSWLGVASPAAPYAGEFGNALYYGIRILNPNNTSGKISISRLAIEDTIDGISFTSFYNASDLYDGISFLGVNYGADQTFNGGDPLGDDVYVNGNQVGSTEVDALFFTGLNWSFIPGDIPAFSTYGSTNAQRLANFIAAVNASGIGQNPVVAKVHVLTESGNLASSITSASSTTTFTPEPSTYALMGLGLAALGI
ncbi:MAG: PEP-CTERM sorting domain-containing protein, partial [Acidobacteriota bacterium]